MISFSPFPFDLRGFFQEKIACILIDMSDILHEDNEEWKVVGPEI